MKKQPRKDAAPPLLLGTGLVALDVIETPDDPSPPKLCTGGTCANVLLALRYLGFESVPVCRLCDDSAAKLIQDEFRVWGVSTTYVSSGEDGSTPVIVQTIRSTPGGHPVHAFSWRCPSCGARFPSYKPVLASTAEEIASEMESPQVYFFDRVSRGALLLASRAAELGALVVFEPSSVGDLSLFREAWSVAHVVKYSHERLAELPDGLEFGPRQVLQIETLGAEGLRYRARLRKRIASPWTRMVALSAPSIKDTAGSGDWCTAGLLHRLGRSGAEGFLAASTAEIEAGLRFAQALAAWNCGYIGARGGMYEATVEECLERVEQILHGRETGARKKSEGNQPVGDTRTWCSACEDAHAKSTRTTA